MSASKALGIVVTDYHTQDELEGFIESLWRSDPQLPYSLVIAVIEASHDEALKASELAEIVSSKALIAGTTRHYGNVGYARACNDGADWLGLADEVGTYAFFNSDCRIAPGVLESCVKLLYSDDSYGICGPRQVDDRGRITHGGIFGTLDKPLPRGWQNPGINVFRDVRDDAVSVSGAAYFIKRSVWDELYDCPIYQASDPETVGAFLQTPHYYEETFCSYHAIAHGYKCVYNGDVTMIHRWHKASPVGGWAEKQFPLSREIFRKACDDHGIAHD